MKSLPMNENAEESIKASAYIRPTFGLSPTRVFFWINKTLILQIINTKAYAGGSVLSDIPRNLSE